MGVDAETQAILLLTAHLEKSSRAEVKPLTPREWGRFACWLHAEGKRPEDLLASGDPASLLHGWHDRTVSHERLVRLLGRRVALGLVLEKWEQAGLWVVTRSHRDYPARLKRRLRYDSPPVLIGCGDRRIMNSPGIAVVGSREASEDDRRFALEYGRKAAEYDHIIVSGGARGVDEIAMLSCIEAGGKAVGILANNLLGAITSAKYRHALGTDQIVLVTPFNPDAGFNVGNAMARNKYIYCCSDAAVVVASGRNKGGTWNGAVEALKAAWVPVWVRMTTKSPDGNGALIRKGAHNLGDRVASPRELVNPAATHCGEHAELLFGKSVNSRIRSKAYDRKHPVGGIPAGRINDALARVTFVEFFVAKLAYAAGSSPGTADEIAKMLNITKTQVRAWLKAAVERGLIVKLNRPVRYRVATDALERLTDRGTH